MPTPASKVSELLSQFDADRPLAQARTIPAAWYSDPDFYEVERQAVFAHSWLPFGRAIQVALPGTYLACELAGEPIMMIRGTDDVLRGFFNVCRHRAAAILTEPHGCVGKLRCQYHGWTYDLEGHLKGTPEFDGVEEFDKDSNGLVPVGAVDTFGPLAFVHLADKPNQTLAEALAPMPTSATTLKAMEGLTWFARKSYDVNCNWKVYVDNYLDGGYHVNTVHPALAGVIEYQDYRTELFTNTSLQSTPLVTGVGAVGRTRTGGRAEYWWVFPNLMVNLYSGVMDTNTVTPLGPTRCRVDFDFFFHPGTEAEFVAESIAVAEQVQREDMEVCEQVQRGLNSRSYDVGRFSVKRETGGYHFQQLLKQRMQKH